MVGNGRGRGKEIGEQSVRVKERVRVKIGV